VENRPREEVPELLAHSLCLHVVVVQVPHVPEWAVHVTDVQLVGTGKSPLCNGVVRRHDDLVIGKVELFDREWGKGKIVPVGALREGKLLNERGLNRFSLQKAALLLQHEVDQAVEGRIRKDLDHLFEYPFGSRIHRKPVVD